MNYRNAQYNKNGTIDCEIEHPKFGWIPFTASPYDCENHSKKLYVKIVKEGGAAKYAAPPPPSEEEIAKSNRELRNSKLIRSDWTQLPDVPQAIKQKWSLYREQLRNLTEQEGWPYNVKWPIPPE